MLEALAGIEAIDRHAAMPETPPVRCDATAERVRSVDDHPVLVSPEPDDGPLDELGELLRRPEVPLVEGRVVLMVAQQHEAAVVTRRAKLHVVTQPLN